MFKKIISFFLLLSLLISSSVQSVCAMDLNPEIEPQWENAKNISISLEKRSDSIFLSVTLDCSPTVTMDSISIGVYKMTKPNQGQVAYWSDMSSSFCIFYFEETIDADPTGGYRVIVRFNAVKNGVSEAITSHLDKTF